VVFSCSICEQESTRICVDCTKDACSNHLCERCGCCSDCCDCEVPLDEPEISHLHVETILVEQTTIEELSVPEEASVPEQTPVAAPDLTRFHSLLRPAPDEAAKEPFPGSGNSSRF